MTSWQLLAEISTQHWAPPERDVLEVVEEPRWEEANRVHDWRNYVPDELREIWGDLSQEGRLAVYLVAQTEAYGEDWE